MNLHHPPRMATALLSFFMPDDEREFQLGDLAERYDYLRRAHPAKAVWWYWGQVMRMGVRFATARDRKPRTREAMHQQSGWSAFFQDVRYALRSLRRTPAFTVVAVLTLAIGIGANTAIFSVVDAVVLRPLPFQNADRLMRVYLLMPNPSGGEPLDMFWSYPKFQTLREAQNIFDDLSLFQRRNATLTEAGDAERISGEIVGPSYFDMLGQRAYLGRTFLPEEGAGGTAQPVAMLSYQLWQRRFAGDPAVVGSSVRLNGVSYPVVGITAPDFRGLTGAAEYFLPTSTLSAGQLNAGAHWMSAIARRRPGVTAEQALGAMPMLGQRIGEAYPSSRAQPWGARARTLEDVRVEPAIRTSVLLLLGAVGFVLLIACVNLANLLLGRATARQREFAIRLSVGANRRRIVRQLLTESAMLALLGGGLGLALAVPAVGFLRRMAPHASGAFAEDVSGLTQMGMEGIGINLTALLFTIGMTLATGVIFGLVPALHASRPDLTHALKEGGGGAPAAGRALRLGTRELLVIAEFALAFVLVVGSGLMIKSFGHLQNIDMGFDPENVLTVSLGLPGADYDRAAGQRFMEQLRGRIRALPGVETVGYNICTPLSTGCNGTGITLLDRPESDAELGVEIHFVSAEYFETLRIPIAAGRAFTSQDREGGRRVAIVSEAAARQFWGGESPIGESVSLGTGGSDPREIVGVAKDVRYNAVEEAAFPTAYIPVNQSGRISGFILVRTSVAPMTVLPSIRQLVRGFDPNLPLSDIQTMEDRLGTATSGARFSAILLSTYSAIALVLAGIGIYGVMSYSVAHRTREMGLRIAMGAERTRIQQLVVGRALAVALAGLTVGLVAAWGLMRILGSLLYEVQPYDPATFAVVAVGLAGLAFVASYLPARRASRVDPMIAIREQ